MIRKRGFTLVELLVVIVIIGVLVSMLLPAVQNAREAARGVQCQNNLRQMGLALGNFESAFHVFPASGWTVASPTNPAGKFTSWKASVLPFLEQANVSADYNSRLHWWEGSNLDTASIPIPSYLCPSTPTLPPVTSAIAKSPRPALLLTKPLVRSDYDAIQGVQPASISTLLYNASNRFAVMHRNSATGYRDILDGATNTITVVEAAARPWVYRTGVFRSSLNNDQGISWADSESAFSLDGARVDGSAEGCGIANGCVRALNARNDNEPYSFHPGGIYALYADGHVQKISESIDLLTMAALCTRAAGEIANVE